ncbi:hypothetical protein [Belliella baltica]|nr:hypothetical protein [Belliella baltica]
MIDFESLVVEEVLQLDQDGPSSVFSPTHIVDTEKYWLFFDQFNYARINKFNHQVEKWSLKKSKDRDWEIAFSDLEFLKEVFTLSNNSELDENGTETVWVLSQDMRSDKLRFLHFDFVEVEFQVLPSPWESDLIEDHIIKVDLGGASLRNQFSPMILPIQNKFITTYSFKNQIDVYDKNSGELLFKELFQSTLFKNEKERPISNLNDQQRGFDKENIFDWNLDVEFSQLYYLKEIDKYIRLIRSETEGSIKRGFKVFLSIYDSEMNLDYELSLSEINEDLSFEHYFVNNHLYIKASNNESEDKLKFYKLKIEH